MPITRVTWNPYKCGKEKLRDEYSEPKGEWKTNAPKNYEICKSKHRDYDYVLVANYLNGTMTVPYKKYDELDEELRNKSWEGRIDDEHIRRKNIHVLVTATISVAATIFGIFLVFAAFSRKQSNRSCLLYTSPSPRDATLSRMPSSA